MPSPDAPEDARVFPITERRINYIVKATAKRAGINPATSAHWLRHAYASHAIARRADLLDRYGLCCPSIATLCDRCR